MSFCPPNFIPPSHPLILSPHQSHLSWPLVVIITLVAVILVVDKVWVVVSDFQ